MTALKAIEARASELMSADVVMLPRPDLDVLLSIIQDFVQTNGHIWTCGHRLWLNGYSNQPGQRHTCDIPDCDGNGQPCSEKCQRARAAIRLRGRV